MADGVKVTVEDNTAEILAALEDVVKFAVADSGNVVAEAAAQGAPKNTGKLAESYHPVAEDQDGVYTVSVTNTKDTFYGRFVELGAHGRPAEPHLFPALEEERTHVEDRVAKAISSLVRG